MDRSLDSNCAAAVPPAVPPFQSGDLIRPITPRHPWRAHRIQVKACHRDRNSAWVVQVRLYMGDALSATVRAGDFEKVTSNG